MATANIDASIDATMDGMNADVNDGSSVKLGIGVLYLGEDKSALFRPIGNFDVSAVAGATINSAKLVREISGVNNGGFDAHLSRCTRPADWTEGGVTWNKYDGTNRWTSGGGDFDDAGPPAKIDYAEASAAGAHEITGLKGFVEDALDNRSGIVSIILRAENEAPGSTAQVNFYSKDNGSDIWHLVVDYTPAGAAGLPERGVLRGVLRGVVRGY